MFTFVLVVLDRPDKLIHFDVHFVGISWWKMREYTTAVDSFPPKRVVGEFVDERPTQLLRNKSLHLRSTHDLRQLG